MSDHTSAGWLHHLILTNEQRRHPARLVRAMRLIGLGLTFTVLSGLSVYALPPVVEAVRQPAIAPLVEPQIREVRACVTPAGGSCHRVYPRYVRGFRAGRLGRARSGFHPANWMVRPARQRHRMIRFLRNHPRLMAQLRRDPRNHARAISSARYTPADAWWDAIRNATCVTPTRHYLGRRAPLGSPICSGLGAIPPRRRHLWTQQRWTIFGVTLCEGMLMFTLRRTGSLSRVTVGSGSFSCLWPVVDQRVGNQL